jgi:DNA-binding LacI/PurR family transcriptional regulator
MAQAPKYEQVMSVIERRVREGDYLLRSIPGERRIAKETGVSYMTARRAVTELLHKKVLIRRENGTLDVHPSYSNRVVQSQVVLLYPAFPSAYLAQLCQIVMSALAKHGQSLRPVQYVHWDDPTVADALANADGALLVPSADHLPARVLETIKAHRVVALDSDLSAAGVPSIQLFADKHITQVFDHLHELGHRRIDCVNTQSRNPEIERRIRLWRKWLARQRCEGRLWDNPAPSFADPTPYAHEIVCRMLDDGASEATALVGTTFPAAIAAVRALWEREVPVGAGDLGLRDQHRAAGALLLPVDHRAGHARPGGAADEVLRLVLDGGGVARPPAARAGRAGVLRGRVIGAERRGLKGARRDDTTAAAGAFPGRPTAARRMRSTG